MIWGTLLFALGLSIGSFVNVLIYRLPKKMDFIHGRSQCPRCQYQLAWYDLIPVISFLWLKGNCRNCRVPISARYPLVELITGVVILANFIQFRDHVSFFIYWSIISVLIIILALFDLSYFILPDAILLILGLFFTVSLILSRFNIVSIPVPSFVSSLIGASAISLFLGSIWFFSGGKGLGFGDVKFGFVIGLIFGSLLGFFIIELAAIIGSFIGLVLIAGGHAHLKTRLPFGTFISLTTLVVIIFQSPITRLLERIII